MDTNEARSSSHSANNMSSPDVPVPAATAQLSAAGRAPKMFSPQELRGVNPDHPQTQEKPSAVDGEESETEEARVERLGRERPAIFKSLWAEIFFCYSILASQFMAVSLPSFNSH